MMASRPTTEHALRATGIHKSFQDGDSEIRVLRGVDLEVEPAEFVALQGPSGSGKSTLLSILGTLMKPTEGSLEIGQQDALSLRGRKLDQLRNEQLGFVYQFHYLLPDFSAIENITMPWTARRGRPNREAREHAGNLLDRVGLADRASQKVTKLSGGQKQRVAIARALMMRPAVVLADEPTGSLDRDNAFEVMELLREITTESGTAFLISTHDLEIADRCDRRVVLADGVVE